MQLNCTKKIEVEFSKCLPPCSGLVVSSFSKSESNKNLEDLVYNEIVSYEKYTKWSQFPGGLEGCQLFNICTQSNMVINFELIFFRI